jgi:hypothetical protein
MTGRLWRESAHEMHLALIISVRHLRLCGAHLRIAERSGSNAGRPLVFPDAHYQDWQHHVANLKQHILHSLLALFGEITHIRLSICLGSSLTILTNAPQPELPEGCNRGPLPAWLSGIRNSSEK